MAVYHDSVGVTKKKKKTTEAKSRVAQDYEAKKKKEEEEKKQRQAQQKANQRRASLPTVLAKNANSGEAERYLRQNGGQYGKDLANARSMIPGAAKTTLANEAIMREQSKRPSALERNPYVQTAVSGAAAIRNKTAPDAATAQYTYEDYTKAMRELERQRAQDRLQEAKRRENNVYRYAKDYSADELSWMQQAAQMGAEYEAERAARSARDPRLTGGNVYQQQNADRTMNEAYRRAEEAEGRAAYLQAAKDYRESAERDAVMQGRYDRLPSDPSFKNQAALGKQRYERTQDPEAFTGDPNESLSKRPADMLVGEKKEIFYALYAQDPQKAQEYAEYTFWKDYQAQMDKAFAWAGQNPLTRGTSWELGRRLGQAAGFQPFTTTGRMMAMMGQALSGGSAQGLQEHGLLNMGDTGKAAQLSSDPYVRALGRRFSAQSLAGTLPEDIEVIGGDGPVAQVINKSISALVGGKGLADVSQLASSMLTSYENAMLTGAFGMLGEGMDPAQAENVAKVGEAIGLALMGSSAAASDYAELMAKGVDQKTAMLHATAAGVAEAAFEKLSLENIIHMRTDGGLKQLLENWFIQAGVEASEETFTTMANRVTDEIIMDTNGYYSAVQERQHELLVQGVPYAEAKAQAEREWLVEILNDALGGFISGGGMTAMNTVQGGIANIQERIEARNERNTVREWIGSAAANEQNAELQAALDQYAKDNKLKGYDQAQIEQVREWNRQQSQQATEEAQSTAKSEREVRRETARGKKAARNVGKVTQAVLNDIEQKTRGKVMREYEADLADVSRRYKGLADTVRETAYNASSDLYGTAKSVRELDTLHKDNVQGVKNDALRQAAISAYNDRMEQLAPKGSRADARWRARQAFSNGALDLSASYGEGDGRVQTQIDGITEDGKKIKLANGEVKTVDELELDADTQDILTMLTTRGLGSVANNVLAEYQAQVKKGDLMSGYGFATDFIRAVEYGRTNQKLASVQAALKNIKDSRTVEVAWKLGREQAQKQAEAGRRSTAANAQTGRKASYQTVEELLGKEPDGGGVKSATGRKGSVDVSRIKGMQLDAAQTAQVQMAKTIARAIGVDVSFFASEADENGRYHGAQGSYRNGVIELDINAGRLSTLAMKSGILKTMSHELTHFIQDYSSDLYQDLKDFAFQVLGEKAGVGGIEELIDEKVARSVEKISRPDAEDEVIADAMETMLGSSEAVKQLYAQNATLADKVLSWLADFMNIVKAAIGPADHREAQIIDELDEQMRKVFQDKWDTALADAANRLAGNVSSERVNDATETIGITVDTQTGSANPTDMQFSERTWTASDYVQHMDAAAEKLAEALDLPKEKAEKYIRDINSVAKMIADDRARLDYYSAPGLSAFKSNSEYGGSIDFSTLCKKRRLFTGTFSAIQRALPNTTLTAQDVLEIRSMMDKAGLEVACGKCYVEGSRAVMGEFTRRFIDQYKQLNPGKWAPNMAQMNTPDGIEWVRQTHPEVYEQYEYFWNHYGKLEGIEGKNLFASQQKPKLYQARTEYKGEVLEEFQKSTKAETQAVVKEKNDNGGLRLQSFSDFELVHLIDCMQVIMDMSRVGLYGQAYTKVPEFAMALGKTGLKINLSIDAWGVDENGKLIFNDKEGMNSQTAFDLRNRFSDNVGTICCVYDDKMLMAALADERIDFIIPFHRSQWKKSQYKAMGLPATTKDYTYQQNEKWLNPKAHTHEYKGRTVPTKVTNYMPNQYWEEKLTGKQNAEKYLRMCAEEGKRPKFYKLLVNNGDGSFSLQPDGSTDGYWKLLIDFKMYNNEGKSVPQQAVKPIFDMDGEGGIKQMLAEYKEGHNRYPVAQGIVDDFVKKFKQEHPRTQYSERDTEYLELAKDPEKNKARLQEMVDEAAREAGYTYRRNTRNRLNAENSSGSPIRMFVRDADGYTDLDNYGKYRYTATDAGALQAADILDDLLQLARDYYEENGIESSDLTEESVNPSDIVMSAMMWDDADFVQYAWDNYFEAVYDRTDQIPALATEDGLIVFGDDNARIKSLDPVTYDDDGNVIPLSERFDTRKEDIRYSERDESLLSDYEIALEADPMTAAKNEEQRRMLTEVQDRIRKVQELQRKLAKARRDAENLNGGAKTEKQNLAKDLQKQINKLTDTIDKNLNSAHLHNLLKEQRKAQRERTMGQYRERRGKADLTRRIRNLREDLQRRILKPTDRTFVPPELAKSLVAVLDTLDVSPKEGTKAAAKYEQINEAVRKMADAYGKLKNDGDEYLSMDFEEEFHDDMLDLANKLDGRRVQDLTSNEMREVYDTVRRIRAYLRDTTKLIGKANAAHTYDYGDRIIADEQQIKQRKDGKKAAGRLTNTLASNVQIDALSPMRAVKMIGGWSENSALYELWRDIEDGNEIKNDIVMESNKTMQPFRTGKNEKTYLDALRKKLDFGIKDTSKQTVRMTKLQAIQLYMTWQREANNDKLAHLQNGFASIRDADLIANGKSKQAAKTAQNIKVTPEMIAKIEKSFTEWDKGYIKAARDVFHRILSDSNKVQYALRHTVMQGEEYYIPITVDGNYLTVEPNKADVTQIGVKNPGSTKPLETRSGKPVIIDGLDVVLNKHISDMAGYIGLAVPIRNFVKVWNVSQDDANGDRITVKSAISGAWGDKANDMMMETLKQIQNMNSGHYATGLDAISRNLNSAFAKSALVGRPSVVIKQAASYAAAGSVLKQSALDTAQAVLLPVFLSPNSKFARNIYERADRLTSELYMRRLGMSMVEIAQEKLRTGPVKRVTDQIGASLEQNAFGRIVRRTSAWLNPGDWIQRMDVATTTALFVACEHQAKFEKLKPNTEAFDNRVRELYNQVITQTQPMYDPLYRNQLQKSKVGSTVQAMFPFKTVPFQNYGQIMDSIGSWQEAMRSGDKEQKKQASRHMAKTMYANFLSALVFAGLTILGNGVIMHKMKKWRDDDDELTAASLAAQYAKDVGDVMLSNLLPYGGSELKEIVERLGDGGNKSYFDVFSIGTLDLLNDTAKSIFDAWEAWGDKDASMDTKKDKLAKMVLEVTTMFGLPVRNMVELKDGIAANIRDIQNGNLPALNNDVDRSNSVNAKRYMDAVLDEDAQKRDAVWAEMEQSYRKEHPNASDKKVQQVVRSAVVGELKERYLDGEIDEDAATAYLLQFGGLGDANDAYWKLREWEANEAHKGEEYNYSPYEKLRAAVRDGGDIQAAMDELTSHGKDFADANGAIKSAVKDLWTSRDVDDSEAMDLLQKYWQYKPDGGTFHPATEDDAWFALKEWKDKADHEGDEDYDWSKYGDIYNAIDDNNPIDAAVRELVQHGMKERIINDQVKSYIKHRFETGEITEHAFKNMLSRYCGITKTDEVDELVREGKCYMDTGYRLGSIGTIYKDGDIKKSQAKQILQKYGAMSATEADQNIGAWDFQVAHPKLEWDASTAKYYLYTVPKKGGMTKSASQMGIKPEVYEEFRVRVKDITGTDEDNDGETDRGSKKQPTLELIDSLHLTPEQKDWYYFKCNYGEKDLYKAPWH